MHARPSELNSDTAAALASVQSRAEQSCKYMIIINILYVDESH